MKYGKTLGARLVITGTILNLFVLLALCLDLQLVGTTTAARVKLGRCGRFAAMDGTTCTRPFAVQYNG